MNFDKINVHIYTLKHLHIQVPKTAFVPARCQICVLAKSRALKHKLLSHSIIQCSVHAVEIYNYKHFILYLFQEAKDDSGCIVCPLCDKSFQTQHQLTMHIRQVTCTCN